MKAARRREEIYKLLEYANYIRLEEEKNCFFAVIKIHEKKLFLSSHTHFNTLARATKHRKTDDYRNFL